MEVCELNGICDEWETHEDCPSDCPEEPETTTTTTVPTTATTALPSFGAICGNGECEETEDLFTCPEDCAEEKVEENVTAPGGPLGMLTGFMSAFGDMSEYDLYGLMLILLIMLAVLRYLILPRII